MKLKRSFGHARIEQSVRKIKRFERHRHVAMRRARADATAIFKRPRRPRDPRRVGLLRLSRVGGVSARLLDEGRDRREGGLVFAEADERQPR